jgi:hypothetical protein
MVLALSSMNIASGLLQSSSKGFDYSAVFSTASGSGSSFGPASVGVALKQAERDEARQLETTRKSPDVARDIARYRKVISRAKTLDDVLKDPIARKVLLGANGLGDQSEYLGLVKKALLSDPTKADSVANKIKGVNGRWLEMVSKYNFAQFGISKLITTAGTEEIVSNYVEEKRLDTLDKQLPGLGSAVLFKRVASTLDTPIKILGNALGREVVTTALGLPKQLAVQSLEAQQLAIRQRMDASKLKEPAFADKIAQRYLIQLNGGASGLTA